MLYLADISYSPLLATSQRLSVQEVPPLLNGDSSNRSQQQQHQQQQQRAVQPSQSESSSQHSPGPQSFRSLTVVSSSSPLHTPHSSSNGSSTAASTSPSSSGGPVLSQHAPLHISTSSSPSLQGPLTSMSTVLTLSPGPPSSHSGPMQGLTSAPHSPPLPHSAPLSRAMTPVPSGHQGSGTSLLISNPQMMKATEVYATSTLPLPRRPIGETRTGGVGKECSSSTCIFLILLKQTSILTKNSLSKMFFCICYILLDDFLPHSFPPSRLYSSPSASSVTASPCGGPVCPCTLCRHRGRGGRRRWGWGVLPATLPPRRHPHPPHQ